MKSASTPEFSCVQASILFAPTLGSRTSCAASGFPCRLNSSCVLHFEFYCPEVPAPFAIEDLCVCALDVHRYLGVASSTQRGDKVGTILAILRPAASNNLRYSDSVRSRPPFITSMFRSSNLLNDFFPPAGTMNSTSNTLLCCPMERLQFRRILSARSSSQS